eukprot:TRINITY_DN67952_c6_g1_i1.p1 TRINITY_DN67952_c6_g1~~TRINITY_DN67952_c6_g1_i1.p1  ORF type:complete len:510 (-),score=44.15 TRINITY_DN67952_c6_g1_i1:1415-2944(-)
MSTATCLAVRLPESKENKWRSQAEQKWTESFNYRYVNDKSSQALHNPQRQMLNDSGVSQVQCLLQGHFFTQDANPKPKRPHSVDIIKRNREQISKNRQPRVHFKNKRSTQRQKEKTANSLRVASPALSDLSSTEPRVLQMMLNHKRKMDFHAGHPGTATIAECLHPDTPSPSFNTTAPPGMAADVGHGLDQRHHHGAVTGTAGGLIGGPVYNNFNLFDDPTTVDNATEISDISVPHHIAENSGRKHRSSSSKKRQDSRDNHKHSKYSSKKGVVGVGLGRKHSSSSHQHNYNSRQNAHTPSPTKSETIAVQTEPELGGGKQQQDVESRLLAALAATTRAKEKKHEQRDKQRQPAADTSHINLGIESKHGNRAQEGDSGEGQQYYYGSPIHAARASPGPSSYPSAGVPNYAHLGTYPSGGAAAAIHQLKANNSTGKFNNSTDLEVDRTSPSVTNVQSSPYKKGTGNITHPGHYREGGVLVASHAAKQVLGRTKQRLPVAADQRSPIYGPAL